MRMTGTVWIPLDPHCIYAAELFPHTHTHILPPSFILTTASIYCKGGWGGEGRGLFGAVLQLPGYSGRGLSTSDGAGVKRKEAEMLREC